ncbi:MAG: hypothetical protein R3C01_11925 [Planctomycetaceae bacterium]
MLPLDPIPEQAADSSVESDGQVRPALQAADVGWSRRKKRVVSAILLFHLLAIFICPASLGGPLGGSPFLNTLYDRVFHWHLEPLHLMHGFQFFAPEPSAGKVIQYEFEYADGRKELGWQFPHRDRISPRLLYHRYFMLAERLPLGDDEALEIALRSYARHLLQWHGGTKITIYVVEHGLILPRDVLAGADPDSPELFQVIADASWTRAELGLEE